MGKSEAGIFNKSEIQGVCNLPMWISEAKFGLRHVIETIEKLPQNSNILEVGCGNRSSAHGHAACLWPLRGTDNSVVFFLHSTIKLTRDPVANPGYLPIVKRRPHHPQSRSAPHMRQAGRLSTACT